MTFVEYVQRKARRSQSTAETYGAALNLWARTLGYSTPDEAVSAITSGKIDVYKALDDFVAKLMATGFAPRTIWNYLSAVRGFLRHEDVTIDQYKLRDKITLPPKVEISVDRIPTREEVKKLLLEGDLRLKAAITVLASSGMRIGELCKLRVANIDFEKHPVRIAIQGRFSKSRFSRTVRITDEAANLLKEYLGDKIKNREAYVFPSPTNPDEPIKRNALAMSIRRLIERCGLLRKQDPESRRYEIHVHCFRKYFFTQMIAAGVDRGIVEYLMGHKFGLDPNYLRLGEEMLDREYEKHAERLTFLNEISPQGIPEAMQEELANRDTTIQKLQERIFSYESQMNRISRLSDEEIEAVRELIAKTR